MEIPHVALKIDLYFLLHSYLLRRGSMFGREFTGHMKLMRL